MLQSKFSWFPGIKCCLPLRSSSLEVVFNLFKIWKLSWKLYWALQDWFPAYSLLVREDGLLDELKLRLTEPSLAGTGAELGKTLGLTVPSSGSIGLSFDELKIFNYQLFASYLFEFLFHLVKIVKIVLSSTKEDLQISSYFCHIPLRLSSLKVVFHLLKIVVSSNEVKC